MKSNMSVLKKRFTMTKGAMIEGITFRTSYIGTLLCTLMYFIIIYSLWSAIYKTSAVESVNGFDFKKTVIYLVLATALGSFIELPIVWEMDSSFKSGKIILDISKPIKYKNYLFWLMFGRRVDFFIVVFIPLYFLLMFTLGNLKEWMSNFGIFLLSCCFSIIISFLIDFIVGVTVFFTQSVWGINTLKSLIVSLCSGAIIPIDMFPNRIKKIIYYLPFKCIYDSPIKLLLSNNFGFSDYMVVLGGQLLWIAILTVIANIIWERARSVVMINGG